MAGAAYDRQAAEDYRVSREIPRDALDAWRVAIAETVPLELGTTVLDVGAGTGGFAGAFHAWFGVTVLAVEPAAVMRELIPVSEGIRALDAGPRPCPCRTAARTRPGSAR